jgi:hypothetical protein
MAESAITFELQPPPGLTAAALFHCPQWLRDDAVQAAWVAYREGRKPDSAVRAVVRAEKRHHAAKPEFEKCPVAKVRRRF